MRPSLRQQQKTPEEPLLAEELGQTLNTPPALFVMTNTTPTIFPNLLTTFTLLPTPALAFPYNNQELKTLFLTQGPEDCSTLFTLSHVLHTISSSLRTHN